MKDKQIPFGIQIAGPSYLKKNTEPNILEKELGWKSVVEGTNGR